MCLYGYLCPVKTRKDIRAINAAELQAWFAAEGQPKYRSKQVLEWLWAKSATSFDEMSSLSKDLIIRLEEEFTIHTLKICELQKSKDGTIKNAFQLYDGKVVEGVLIPTENRMTACISSQVGCSLTCSFCATGRMERLRNLDAGEMYDQVVILKRQAEENYRIPLSNIVYMGMGEPLLNYNEVLQSVHHITSPEGLGMSPQRITVSTAGIAKMIHKLGDDEVKFNLALSLHAANDEKRNRIMPINEQNSLDSLADALNHFYQKTGSRVTFEYIIFRDFNDSLQDAEDLVAFCKKVTSKVNIIEYNPIEGGEFRQTTSERLKEYVQLLEKNHIIVNVRRSRGKDIDAACGQLANKKPHQK